MLIGFIIINVILLIAVGYFALVARFSSNTDTAGGAGFVAFVTVVGIFPLVNFVYGIIWGLVKLIW